jgi:hypothetical protein
MGGKDGLEGEDRKGKRLAADMTWVHSTSAIGKLPSGISRIRLGGLVPAAAGRSQNLA